MSPADGFNAVRFAFGEPAPNGFGFNARSLGGLGRSQIFGEFLTNRTKLLPARSANANLFDRRYFNFSFHFSRLW